MSKTVNILLIVTALILFFVLVLMFVYYYSLNDRPRQENVSITYPNQSIKPIISVTIESRIPSISASIDSRLIIEKLDRLNFWTGRKKIYETRSAITSSINRLHIVITDQEQGFNKVVEKVDGQEIVYQSAGLEYVASENKLILYLQIGDKYLQKDTADSLSLAYSFMALQRLYGVKEDVGLNQDYEYAQKNLIKFIFITKE